MIVETEALVLKSMRYRETSKIVTFYTRHFGKITGIAKGARGPKSKYGASLEPMTHVSLIFYKKESRDLHMVSKCEIVHLFHRLQSDLEKITVGLAMVELVNAAMHSEERNEMVFQLLVDSISELDRATKNLRNVFYYFRLHLMNYMGFKPDFQSCTRCKRRLVGDNSTRSPIHFDPHGGGFLCSECSQRFPRRIRVSLQTVKVLQGVLQAPLSEVTTIEMSTVSKKEIEGVLRAYEGQHLVGIGHLKSDAVAKSLVG